MQQQQPRLPLRLVCRHAPPSFTEDPPHALPPRASWLLTRTMMEDVTKRSLEYLFPGDCYNVVVVGQDYTDGEVTPKALGLACV